MKIAVLANRRAGNAEISSVLEMLQKAWKDHRLMALRGFGGEAFSDALPEVPAAVTGYLPRLFAALDRLLEEEPELILTVGGDGTAAYGAEHLLQKGAQVPLAGLGSGTANVGPIVSLSPASLLKPEELVEERLGAIEALDSHGAHIAYGFNDLVLGNTFLGTREGRTVTFSGIKLAAEGILEEIQPSRKLFKKRSAFLLNGQPLPGILLPPAQMIASPVEEDSFYGRAVTGLLCYSPDSPYQGAVYLSPEPVVTARESESGYLAWRPGFQLLLKEGDLLEARGLAGDICAVADGNPYCLPEGSLKLRYRPALLKVLRAPRKRKCL